MFSWNRSPPSRIMSTCENEPRRRRARTSFSTPSCRISRKVLKESCPRIGSRSSAPCVREARRYFRTHEMVICREQDLRDSLELVDAHAPSCSRPLRRLRCSGCLGTATSCRAAGARVLLSVHARRKQQGRDAWLSSSRRNLADTEQRSSAVDGRPTKPSSKVELDRRETMYTKPRTGCLQVYARVASSASEVKAPRMRAPPVSAQTDGRPAPMIQSATAMITRVQRLPTDCVRQSEEASRYAQRRLARLASAES